MKGLDMKQTHKSCSLEHQNKTRKQNTVNKKKIQKQKNLTNRKQIQSKRLQQEAKTGTLNNVDNFKRNCTWLPCSERYSWPPSLNNTWNSPHRDMKFLLFPSPVSEQEDKKYIPLDEGIKSRRSEEVLGE